jgi:hypothetical protein
MFHIRVAGTRYEEDLMLGELFGNMLHSTVQGFIGVIGIFTYLAAIVVAALYRIKEGMNEHHH